MGYSARYHAASLAAVFLALGVGILIGVGLGKNVVNDTTRNLEASLKGDLSNARGQVSTLQGESARSSELSARRSIRRWSTGRLPGGKDRGGRARGLDSALRADIERTLGADNQTGARIREFAVVREPPDVAGARTASSAARAFIRSARDAADLAALRPARRTGARHRRPAVRRTSGAAARRAQRQARRGSTP